MIVKVSDTYYNRTCSMQINTDQTIKDRKDKIIDYTF